MYKKILILFLFVSVSAFSQEKLIVLSLDNDSYIGVKKYDRLEYGLNIKPVVGRPQHIKYSSIKELKVEGVSEEKNGIYHYVRFGEPKEITLPNGRKRRAKKESRAGSLMKLLYDGEVKLYEDTKIIPIKKDGVVTSKTKTEIKKYIKVGTDDPFPVKGKRQVLEFFNKCPEVAEKIDARFRLNEVTTYLDIYNKHCAKQK
jgi:hypothetical protein